MFSAVNIKGTFGEGKDGKAGFDCDYTVYAGVFGQCD
jgi:hypothetical protein